MEYLMNIKRNWVHQVFLMIWGNLWPRQTLAAVNVCFLDILMIFHIAFFYLSTQVPFGVAAYAMLHIVAKGDKNLLHMRERDTYPIQFWVGAFQVQGGVESAGCKDESGNSCVGWRDVLLIINQVKKRKRRVQKKERN